MTYSPSSNLQSWEAVFQKNLENLKKGTAFMVVFHGFRFLAALDITALQRNRLGVCFSLLVSHVRLLYSTSLDGFCFGVFFFFR